MMKTVTRQPSGLMTQPNGKTNYVILGSDYLHSGNWEYGYAGGSYSQPPERMTKRGWDF